MSRTPGFAIAIDFGAINRALSGTLGIARGLSDKKYMQKNMGIMSQNATAEFGRHVDALAGTVPHVYEYSGSGDGIVRGPSGRLWHLTWQQRAGDMYGTVMFRNSRVPTRPDPDLEVEAAEKGRTMASHLFPRKAFVLEYEQTLFAEAGVQRETTRIGGDANPTLLVWKDEYGKTRWAKTRTWENEFYGRYRDVFLAFWSNEVTSILQPRVERAYRKSMQVAGGKLRRIPGALRVPAGLNGLIPMDGNRISTRFNINHAEVERLAEITSKTVEKELSRAWRM